MAAQEGAGLDPDFWLVASVRGQPLLLPASDDLLRRVTLGATWRPNDDPGSPVEIEPDLRHG